MKEKVSKSFVLIVILTLISICFIFTDHNIGNEIIKNELISNETLIINSEIDNFVYKVKNSYGYFGNKGIEEYITYQAKISEIVNYPYTKQFKLDHPEKVAVRTFDQHFRIEDRNTIDNSGINIEKFDQINEEPKIIESKSTNISDNEKINFFDMLHNNYDILKTLKKPYIVIKGKRNKINIDTFFINTNDSVKQFAEIIIGKFENMDKEYKYAEKDYSQFSIIIEISESIENFKKDIEFYNINYIRLLRSGASLIASSLIMILVSLFSNYYSGNSFIEILKKIPIEIYCFTLLIGGYLTEPFIRLNERSFDYPNMLINHMLVQVLVYTFISIVLLSSIYYIFIILKSLYFEGITSPVVTNSIIYRLIYYLIKGVINLFKFIIEKVIGSNFVNKTKWGAIISTIFGIGLFLNNNLYWIIIGITLAGIGFYLINDLLKIENASKNIRNGKFDNNIDVKTSLLSNISENLENINLDFNNAVESAIKSERMKTELLTNVSHDLKTPLTSIINYSDILINTDVKEEDKEKYLNIINEKSLKLKVLIESLFEVSRVASKNVEIHKSEFSLNQMLEQISGEWISEFEEKNIELIVSGKETTVNLDPEKTSRIFDNLFSNIYKYALENTRVYIDIETEDERTTVTLKNISKFKLNISPDELIERFTRGDESRNTEGSGLGLAIASSLTELQGGEFDIFIDGDSFKTILKFN